MALTPEKAAALRKPFEPQQVGKLPKPFSAQSQKGNCRECGGYHGMPAVHLDYVGHAATTDRLLQVDPEWSWEPLAYDMAGLPMLDANRNLWIKLTVCGVTRLGVGDGKSLKELIGDAIRNAAMRFGVALDLWAKEDLHAMDVERGSEATSPVSEPKPTEGTRTMSRKAKPAAKHPLPAPAVEVPDPPEDGPGTISKAQLRKLHTCFSRLGIESRDSRLGYAVNLIGHPLATSNDLTRDEANRLINALEVDAQEPPAEESA